jgi:hypothetical protein
VISSSQNFLFYFQRDNVSNNDKEHYVQFSLDLDGLGFDTVQSLLNPDDHNLHSVKTTSVINYNVFSLWNYERQEGIFFKMKDVFNKEIHIIARL